MSIPFFINLIRSSAVGPWGGMLLEDEVGLVGEACEPEAFHARGQREFLDECLRTTPKISSKNPEMSIGEPKLSQVAELLSDLVNRTGLVIFH